MSETKSTVTEEIQITADKLVETVKNLIHEGNVRHIAIKNPEGKTLVEFPVSIGVVGFLIAPMLAPVVALAAVVAVASDFKIVVTREGPDAKPK